MKNNMHLVLNIILFNCLIWQSVEGAPTLADIMIARHAVVEMRRCLATLANRAESETPVSKRQASPREDREEEEEEEEGAGEEEGRQNCLERAQEVLGRSAAKRETGSVWQTSEEFKKCFSAKLESMREKDAGFENFSESISDAAFQDMVKGCEKKD